MIKRTFNKRQYISMAATICVMILIFCFSAQSGVKSQNTSDCFTRFILWIFKDWTPLTDIEEIRRIEIVRFVIRKFAHFSIYMALSLAATGVFFSKSQSLKILALKTIGLCFFYAISDEIHQLFVAGRSASVRDVCIDTLGATTGFLIAVLVYRHIHNNKNKE